ncbi:MAG TPA: protein kinase [Pseudomonadota bacterium]|nr:protein kinase [Pseudomonadota bacterium]
MAGTVRDSALSGQVVANYRVGRLIGRGGMGAVYEAVHQYLGRRAALKVLHAQFTQTPELTARFINEARAANVVQHPSVVSVFEIGQLEDGTRYILMEYLDGPRLSQRIRELTAAAELPAAEGGSAAAAASRVIVSVRLVRQLASALRALHDKGVIHRDLKPDNILVVKDPEAPGGERAKLLDFGIAKFLTEQGRVGESPFPGVPAYVKTAFGALLGTPMYMGPEQWRGKGNVDHRADIYSLGCIFFELLTGRPPYSASAIPHLMQMHVWQKPPQGLFTRPDIPNQLAELVQRMMAKEPAERPTTIEVEEQLEHILAQLLSPAAAERAKGQVATLLLRPDAQAIQATTEPAEDATMPIVRQAPIRAGQLARPPLAAPAMPGRATAAGALPPAEPDELTPIPPAERTSSGSAQLVPIGRRRPGLRYAIAGLLLVFVLGGVARLIFPPTVHVGPASFPIVPYADAELPRAWRIRSLPIGVEVRDAVTGRLLGQTPLIYRGPMRGQVSLILSRPGYEPRRVTLSHDDLSFVTVKLRRSKR